MIIRKTARKFIQFSGDHKRGPFKTHHAERVLRETWWLLFIPVYSRDTIEAAML